MKKVVCVRLLYHLLKREWQSLQCLTFRHQAWTSSSDDEMISSTSDISIEESNMIHPYVYPILVYHRYVIFGVLLLDFYS